jgi:hypothetical protein
MTSMYARHIVSALIVGGFWALSGPVAAQSGDEHATLSFSTGNVSREHNYQVDARVRPLLFWIRKSNVGDGRITWRTGPGGSVGYELLVGTDPARTPRRINRWGYLREESAPQGGIVFGIMSQSDEQSVEEADKNTGGSGDAVHSFKALRQQVTEPEARLTISNVRVDKDLTYANLDALLAAVPDAPSQSKTVPIAAWTSPGFLAATASLIDEGRTATAATRSVRAMRVYPYNGQLYELHLQGTERIDRFSREARTFGPAIRGKFRVVNLKTRNETPFTVVYGVDGELTGVPLFISFRPRWWLEVECVLSDPPASAVATR